MEVTAGTTVLTHLEGPFEGRRNVNQLRDNFSSTLPAITRIDINGLQNT